MLKYTKATIAYHQWIINGKCVQSRSDSDSRFSEELEEINVIDLIKEFFRRLNIGIILIFVAVTLLWNTPVVYPLKIFVVFMHEISHGIAAMATGGQIVEIVVVSQEGGHAITRGGSPFWTLTAGYLGSLVWGGLILLLAARARLDKTLSVILGLGMIAVSILYLRNPFGLGFGIAFGAALLISGKFLNRSVNRWILQVIGVTSCLYAILDIKSDILDRAHLRSDARMLAEMTNIPTLFWGVLWILLAIAGTIFFLYVAGGGERQRTTAGDRISPGDG